MQQPPVDWLLQTKIYMYYLNKDYPEWNIKKMRVFANYTKVDNPEVTDESLTEFVVYNDDVEKIEKRIGEAETKRKELTKKVDGVVKISINFTKEIGKLIEEIINAKKIDVEWVYE